MGESPKGLSSEGHLEPRDASNSWHQISMEKDAFQSRWKVQCMSDELRMGAEWQIANSWSGGWCLGQKEAKPSARILATKDTKDSLSGHLANPLEQGGSQPRVILPPQRALQCLQTFLLHTTGRQLWHPVDRTQGCCWISHDAQGSRFPHQRTTWPVPSGVSRLTNPAPEQYSSNCIPLASHRTRTHLVGEEYTLLLGEGRFWVRIHLQSSVTP